MFYVSIVNKCLLQASTGISSSSQSKDSTQANYYVMLISLPQPHFYMTSCLPEITANGRLPTNPSCKSLVQGSFLPSFLQPNPLPTQKKKKIKVQQYPSQKNSSLAYDIKYRVQYMIRSSTYIGNSLPFSHTFLLNLILTQ